MVPLSPKKSTGGSKNLLNLLTSVHPFLGIFEAAQFFFDFLLTLAKSPVEKSHLTIFSDAPLASFLAWQIWEKSPSIVDVFEALGIIQDTTKHIWAHQPKMFDSTIRHLTIFRERTVNTYTILHYRSLHYTFPYQPASIYNQHHTTWTNRLGQFFFWSQMMRSMWARSDLLQISRTPICSYSLNMYSNNFSAFPNWIKMVLSEGRVPKIFMVHHQFSWLDMAICIGLITTFSDKPKLSHEKYPYPISFYWLVDSFP